MNPFPVADFAVSSLSLVVFHEARRIFESQEDGLEPLLVYLQRFNPPPADIVVFDRVVGQAAALLLILARARAVHTPRTTRSALETLKAASIICEYLERVEYILNQAGTGPCPMEILAQGKSPVEFYTLLAGGAPAPS